MKILKSIQHTAFTLFIFTELMYAQDFKIAPNTSLPAGSNFSNVSIASDSSSGFLVTWLNTYNIQSFIYFKNYACRFSKTGEMLDSTAIFLSSSGFPYYGPNAVFAGGNWIVVSHQGGLFESVGVQRLTPSGVVLDSIPVNVCNSDGMATVLYPAIATNGNEVLSVMYAADRIYGSIFDPDLNMLVNKFFILEPEITTPGSKPRISVNGNNFFMTFVHWEQDTTQGYQNYPYIKLVIINPQGQILSIQNVSAKWNKRGYFGFPAITTVNDTTYITYYHTPYLYSRRYFSDGQPIDSQPVKLFQSADFESIGKLVWYPATNQVICHWTDLICENDLIHFFWPRLTDNGISLFSFKPDLSIISQPASLDGQCQIAVETPARRQSFSLIRASSLSDNTLTAWIDEREGNTRVYGNFFDIGIVSGVKHEKDRIIIPEDFSISQNYPNPFNSSTTIQFEIRERATVRLSIYDITGRLINTLFNEAREAGYYTVNWNSTDLMGKPVASGVYFSRFDVITKDKKLYKKVRKMILIR
jgi:hypothetical protein